MGSDAFFARNQLERQRGEVMRYKAKKWYYWFFPALWIEYAVNLKLDKEVEKDVIDSYLGEWDVHRTGGMWFGHFRGTSKKAMIVAMREYLEAQGVETFSSPPGAVSSKEEIKND
jgi:hypothetical protein